MSSTFISRPSFVVGGKTFQEQASLNVNLGAVLDPPAKIPAAKAGGSITTRTDNDTCIVTMPGGHGIITGDRIDVYWDIGGVKGSRRGMAATVAVNAVTLDLGAGDNLPANLSPVILAIAQPFDLDLTGSNLTGVCVYTEKRGSVVFAQNDGTLIYGKHLLRDGKVWGWDKEDGETNPLAGGAIGQVFLSHSDTTAARIMRVGYGV
jgi:hypothetical protein